jgi:hypothetical protein
MNGFDWTVGFDDAMTAPIGSNINKQNTARDKDLRTACLISLDILILRISLMDGRAA